MLTDTLTFTKRTLKHITRSADTIITTAMMPIAFMLLFVYVFGGAIKQSIGAGTYINYLLPGILLMTIISGVSYTGYRLYEDRQSGMINRVKTLPVKASSFLWGHVITTLIANLISMVVVVLIALLMGFRTNASLGNWLLAFGILMLFNLAFTWLMVIPGIVAKTMTGATALSYPLMFLPFISSAFVPTATMPKYLRIFAEHQPITIIANTLRAIFMDQKLPTDMVTGIIWMVVITIVSYLIAKFLYRKIA